MKKRVNICFDCQRACGDCSWSEYDLDREVARLKPVEGWTAKLVMYQNCGYTYEVTECPLFVPDRPKDIIKVNNFKKCCLCGKEINGESRRRKYCETCVPDGWYYNEQYKKLFKHNYEYKNHEK